MKQQGTLKIGIILILLTILGVGLFLLKNMSKTSESQPFEPPQNIVQVPEPFIAPTEASPSIELLEKVSKLITIKPKNQELIKEVVTLDSCNNTVGLTGYRDANFTNFMVINNKNLDQTKDAQAGLRELEDFLNNKIQVVDFERNIDQAFRSYCGGHYSYFLKELHGIDYPGFDKFKVVMSETGQGVFGSISVLVYAQKGDQFVKLSKMIEDENLYIVHQEGCNREPTFDEARKCYKAKLLADPALESIARKNAQELIKLFEI